MAKVALRFGCPNQSKNQEEMKKIITIIQHQFQYLTTCPNNMIQTEIAKFVTVKVFENTLI